MYVFDTTFYVLLHCSVDGLLDSSQYDLRTTLEEDLAEVVRLLPPSACRLLQVHTSIYGKYSLNSNCISVSIRIHNVGKWTISFVLS